MHQASSDLIRVIDLETTGNSFTDGGVVEIGWQDVRSGTDGWEVVGGGPGATLVRPPHPISPNTAAIHHIVDEDVVGAPTWLDAAPPVLTPGDDGFAPRALAAHRAAFEQRWCGTLARGLPWICTYKCALRVWPDAPTHSNQGLRYWRRPDGLDRATGLPAHRAGPDAYVTAHHLRDLLRYASVDELLRWSSEPALLVRVPFGPWRGRRWSDLADDALSQLASGEGGGNADVLFTGRTEQARRAAAAPSLPPVDQPTLPL